ncbi:MAG: DUF222 domain-containing protein [Nocardioides sp.]
MTALLDLHPTPGHPGVVVAGVHEALDEADTSVLLERNEYAGLVGECERAIRRLEALKLALVAAADRAKVNDLTGHASTGAWLASETRTGSAKSARDARLATDLDQKLPETAAALADGEVSSEHASVIANATRKLPAGLTEEQVRTVEAKLVEKAKRLDPGQLRRVARRALEAVERDQEMVDAHENQQLEDEEAAAYKKCRLTLHDNGDGTTTGHFTVPTLAASILRKILDSMTAPRRARPGGTNAQAADPATRGDWAHQTGVAFNELLGHLPTDHLHGKTAATVVVTLDLDTLREQLKAAGLDTGDLVSAAEARRLACQAGIVPAVLGGQSQPLDLGRSKRLFTEAQRIALGLRHTTCAADGCERPYAWCELHHHDPWRSGSRTDLDNALPLCGFHHRRIHDTGYLHRRQPDGSLRFSQRT